MLRRSKYAALALVGYLFIALLTCYCIRAKYALIHNWDQLSFYADRFCCSAADAKDRLKRLKKLGKRRSAEARAFSEKRQKVKALSDKVNAGTQNEDDQRELRDLEDLLEKVYEDKMVSLDM